jgi:hypothetical protein
LKVFPECPGKKILDTVFAVVHPTGRNFGRNTQKRPQKYQLPDKSAADF